MRLATFNVNSVRRRVGHLRRFLDRHAPDLVFLQETKCRAEEFPALEFAGTGYRVHAVGQQGGRNGVAVLGRVPFEVVGEALRRRRVGRACALHRGRGRWRAADRRHLPAQREFGRRGRLRLQAALDGAAARLDAGAAGPVRALRGARRLQRLPDRCRFGAGRAAADGRAGAPGKPVALPRPAPSRDDGRAPGAAPGRTRRTPTGTTARPSRPTAACASTTCCSARSWRSG